MNIRDLIERIIWTGIQTAGATLVGASTMDGIEVWHAAGLAGLAAAITALTTFARVRLNQLDA